MDKARVKGSDWITSSDPQAWVTIESQTKRTSKVSNTDRPYWEETLRFECVSPKSPIHVTVFDYDGAFEGNDDELLYADWKNWNSGTLSRTTSAKLTCLSKCQNPLSCNLTRCISPLSSIQERHNKVLQQKQRRFGVLDCHERRFYFVSQRAF